MSTLAWVLAGIVVYTVAALLLKRQGYLPESVGVQGPILTLHTKRGRDFLDWLASPKRFWRAWSNFGVGIALVVMASTFLLLLLFAVETFRNPPPASAINQPRNFLAIPGVNDFLPLSVAPEIVTGLVVGLIVHEGGHGLLCRVEDIDIESMGLAFIALIPVGAFVEPNEESQKRASRGGRTRMFAAGVTNNFAITIVVFALLFGPVIASIGVAPGAAVAQSLPGSTAAQGGIDQGDRITAINGTQVQNNSHLVTLVDRTDSRSLRVEVNGERTTTVTRSVQVVGVLQNGPVNVSRGEHVRSVNGTPVHTESAYLDALRNREVVTVQTDRASYTFPAGAYVVVSSDGPFESAGAPAGETAVVTSIDGKRTVTREDLSDVLAGIDPNRSEPVEVTAYVNGSRETYSVDVVPDQDGQGSLLGVRVYPGVTGMTVDDFGVRTYPAAGYLTFLGGNAGGPQPPGILQSFFGKIGFSLFLPLIGQSGLPGFDYNFAGFTGYNTNFYQATGPLGFLGNWIFLVANLLYWIGWINVQLGFFNCIPAFPLDGGHILRSSAEAVFSRIPIDADRQAVRFITTSVGVTMLLSLLLLVFGPQLLR